MFLDEAERFLLRALTELHIALPEGDVAIRRYACQLAQQMVDQHLPAREGIQRLYKIWVARVDEPDYLVWLSLDDALASLLAGTHPFTYEAATLDTFDTLARQEAKEFLTKMQACE